MENTKSATVELRNKKGEITGKIIVERTMEVKDNISYADGWNINLGRKIVDLIDITVYDTSGNVVDSSGTAPIIITEWARKNLYKQTLPDDIVAKVGNRVYLSQGNYDRLAAAITDIETELVTPEYAAIVAAEKAAEIAAEKAEKEIAEQHKIDLANGLCPICGTYCYGDCQAN